MALGYLLGAALQVEDTNGKPLTGGSIRVCHHGTSEPYITYRDFDGNRNPEYVPLNSDGMAVIIADDTGLYDVYCYNRFGGDAWSRLNVTVGGAAIGNGAFVLESSDGSIDITSTSSGAVTTYDFAVADDSTELLAWIKTSGYTVDGSGNFIPTYGSGTMSVGSHGVELTKDQYYHVTARLISSTSTMPIYNEINLIFKGYDAESESYTTYLARPVVVDCSTQLTQEFEVSFDVIPATDVELAVAVSGLESGVSAGLLDMQIHRVYSGMPHLPDGVATRTWVTNNFQQTLVAGEGINIDSSTNTISVEGGAGISAGFGIDINSEGEISVDTSEIQGKLTAGSGILIDQDNEISVDYTAVQPLLTAGTGISISSNTISTTVDGVPSRTSSDNGKVLGVTDAQGTLGWVVQSGGSSNVYVYDDSQYPASTSPGRVAQAIHDVLTDRGYSTLVFLLSSSTGFIPNYFSYFRLVAHCDQYWSSGPELWYDFECADGDTLYIKRLYYVRFATVPYWTWIDKSKSLVPAFTPSDIGKTLQVVADGVSGSKIEWV